MSKDELQEPKNASQLSLNTLLTGVTMLLVALLCWIGKQGLEDVRDHSKKLEQLTTIVADIEKNTVSVQSQVEKEWQQIGELRIEQAKIREHFSEEGRAIRSPKDGQN